MPTSVCKGRAWLGFDSGEIILKEASLGGLSTHTHVTQQHMCFPGAMKEQLHTAHGPR